MGNGQRLSPLVLEEAGLFGVAFAARLLQALGVAERNRWTFAVNDFSGVRRIHGRGRWRKRKGIARVRLWDGSLHMAEVHWYEAAGIGRKEFKIKHLL